MVRPGHRHPEAILIPLLILAGGGIPEAAASTAEEFLNAPVWYLEYEVTFESASQGTQENLFGTTSFRASVNRVFSGAAKLNLRSGGPGAMTIQVLMGNRDGAPPSAAESQKLSMKMMELMDHTANWLVGGAGIDGNEADPTAGMMGEIRPASLDYTRVDTGRGLVTEMGTKYDWDRTTTLRGAGNVQGGGFGTIILELDSAAGSYGLQLPLNFDALEAKATRETVDIVKSEGSPPTEERHSEEVRLDYTPSGLALDEPPPGSAQGGVYLVGKIDPGSGKISGEQSLPAHYNEQNTTASGTLTFKYVLSMTAPGK